MKDSVLKKFCEYEKKGGVFPLLPVSFKWIGLGISVISIIAMLLIKYNEIENIDFYKNAAMHLILLGLFLIVLSKDHHEDERIQRLRYRAFAFAFVLGTFMLLLMPLAAIILDSVNNRFPLVWEQDQSFFFIISSYLFYFLMYFQIFKRQL